MSIIKKVYGKISKFLGQSRHEFNLVHPTDRKEYFKSIGIFKKVKNGEAECAVCGSQLEINEIRRLESKNGEILIICNNLDCNLEAKCPTENHGSDYQDKYMDMILEQNSTEVITETSTDTENSEGENKTQNEKEPVEAE